MVNFSTFMHLGLGLVRVRMSFCINLLLSVLYELITLIIIILFKGKIMRKIILAAAAATTMLTSSAALAGTEDAFYLKANVGWNKMQDVKYDDNDKLKSENAFLLGLGVGYYLMDNVRFDMTFDHYFDPEFKFSEEALGTKYTKKVKTKVDALLLNGYVDLFDMSIAKVFAGAGVGMARIGGEVSDTTEQGGTPKTIKTKIKNENKFTYALHLGASMEFAPGVNGDLSYSWRDFGEFKDTKFDVKGHNVVFGVRFDM